MVCRPRAGRREPSGHEGRLFHYIYVSISISISIYMYLYLYLYLYVYRENNLNNRPRFFVGRVRDDASRVAMKAVYFTAAAGNKDRKPLCAIWLEEDEAISLQALLESVRCPNIAISHSLYIHMCVCVCVCVCVYVCLSVSVCVCVCVCACE